MSDPTFGPMFGAIDRALDSALRRAFAGAPGAAGPLALAPPPAGGLGGGELAPWAGGAGAAAPTGSAMLPGYMPAADVAEHDDRYEVHLDAPALSEDDVSVTLHEGVLTVRAHPKAQAREERDAATGRLIRRERFSSSWSRSFALPADADDEGTDAGVAATLERGLLTVVVPKKKQPEEGRGPKRIAVRAGGGAAATAAGGGKKGKHAAAAATTTGGAAGGAEAEGGGDGGGSPKAAKANGGSPKAAKAKK